jgi:hypothetical protein
MLKKGLIFISILITSIIFSLFNMKKVDAFHEIGNNGVDIKYAPDFHDEKEVRKEDYIIEWDNEMSNTDQIDTINVNYKYDGNFNIDALGTQGYQTIIVKISMWIWEFDDGYQRIFIYNSKNDTKPLVSGEIDHCGSNVGNPIYYTFYFELKIEEIENNNFVIRYGARGAWNNNWGNSELHICAGASKERRKTDYMWQISWQNPEKTYYTYRRLNKC